MSDQELQEMIDEADRDGDGEVRVQFIISQKSEINENVGFYGRVLEDNEEDTSILTSIKMNLHFWLCRDTRPVRLSQTSTYWPIDWFLTPVFICIIVHCFGL